MADDNDIPPVPLPPADVKAESAVPPVEAAPVVPQPAPAPDAAAPVVAPAPPAYGPPATTPAPPAYGTPPAYAAPPPAYGAAPAQPGYGTPPPAYGAQPGYAQSPYAAQPAGPAQGLSITSMVLGLVGLLASLLWLGFLPALAAVITGHLAQKRQPWARGFWLTGLITGYIGVGIGLISGLGIIVFALFASSYSN